MFTNYEYEIAPASVIIMNVSCYICSNSYSMKNITAHIPVCLAKWDIQQMKLPQNQRLPPPLAPKDLAKVLSGQLKGKELEEFNTAALKEWNQMDLAVCKYCKR